MKRATEETKILSLDGFETNQFGFSVSIDGDYAVVGEKNGRTTLYNPHGAAYVFHRTAPNIWDSGTKIISNDIENSNNFGFSVCISGDYVIVGDPYCEDSGTASGTAFVFHRTGENTWDSGTKLTASDGEGSDYFGYSTAIDGSCVIIGAPGDDDQGDYAGAAYIYDLVGEIWVYRTKITPLNGDEDDRFGEDVSIDGDYALIGVHRDDDIATNAGSAFLFHRTGTYTWSEDKFYASDYAAEDYYGYSADICGNYALIGAYQDDDKGSSSGSAYLYYIERD
jgi:hypothetical protein